MLSVIEIASNDCILAFEERDMEYIKLYWEHDLTDEPNIILYEVDAENGRWAERSIDIFRDGSTRNISDFYANVIEAVPIPTVEEFDSGEYGEEFHAYRITREEFDGMWDRYFM